MKTKLRKKTAFFLLRVVGGGGKWGRGGPERQ